MYLEYPTKDEGFLSILKNRYCSNEFMIHQSVEARIYEYALTETHSRGWSFKGCQLSDEKVTKQFPVKMLADLVESVTGAIYHCTRDLKACIDFLNKHVKLIPHPPNLEGYQSMYSSLNEVSCWSLSLLSL